MPNTYLTIDMITARALKVFHQKCKFLNKINRQYDKEFAKTGAKIGETLRIRKPVQYSVTDGPTLTSQDSVEESTTLTVSTQKKVDLYFGSKERTLEIDDYTQRFIEPAISKLVAAVEYDVMSNVALGVNNLVGTPGTTPNSLQTYLQAKEKLHWNLIPDEDNVFCGINPTATTSIVDALKGLFQDSSSVASQYKQGLMGRTAGMNFFESTHVPSHTLGSMGGTPLVNGASQTGSTIAIDGWTGGNTITAGTVFTLAGVYAVHPELKHTLTHLQQFVVTADATASGGGAATLSIYPSINTSGARQTVSASPANDAVVTVVGTASTSYPQNIAFHPEAFAFVTADLPIHKGSGESSRANKEGVSMRVWSNGDIVNDKGITRVDILYGYAAVRPEWACRIIG